MTQDFLVATQAGADERRLTVVVQGEVDLLTAPELDRELADAVSRRPDTVLVDLSQVTFLDSSGCNALVQGKRRADNAGVGFELHEVTPACLRVFEIAGLTEILGLPRD